MKKPAVLLIRNAYAHDFGGGERFPVHVAEILQQHNYHPVILSRSTAIEEYAKDRHIAYKRSPWLSWQNWSNWRILFLPIYLLWQVILFGWYTAVFIRYRPFAIHLQSKDDFIAGTLAGRLSGCRVIWTDHADLKHIWRNVRVWYKNPIGKLVHFAARFAHAISVVSKSEYKEVTQHLSATSPAIKKLTVIYNGCADRATVVKSAKSTPFTFCIASRLVTDKGIKEAIDAFTALQAHHSDIHLRIIGDGPEAERFKRDAAHNPHITFTGHQKDPLPQMASSNVFLQPTYHEGFSIVLVEASMLGLPIIATNVGGNKEIIFHEKTGLLVEAKNSTQLADAMQRLYSDADLRTQLGKHARAQYLRSFVFDDIITKQFIPLYKGESL